MSEKGTCLRTSRALAAIFLLHFLLSWAPACTSPRRQWRSLTVPSRDLAVFLTRAAKSYSTSPRRSCPLWPGYLLGDHFHPICSSWGWSLLSLGTDPAGHQDLLIAVSAWPLVRLASRPGF